ncbi:hypothetical protein WN55_04795, partial [Dufourea novaeangliae]
HENSRWTEILLTVLLGIRSAWREDLKSTAAELVYGETLRLPGDFLSPRPSEAADDVSNFVVGLRRHFQSMSPVSGTRRGSKRTFIFKDLAEAEQVFLRNDVTKGILQQPYDGPFKVLSRGPKTFALDIRGKRVTVTIDRLKPAYTVSDDSNLTAQHPMTEEDRQQPLDTPVRAQRTARSGRRVRFPARLQVS